MNISAGEFKAKCLKLMDKVNITREEIIITKYGVPVAKLVPIKKVKKSKGIFGCLEGSVEILGDIVAPTGEKWDAEQE